MPDRNLSYNQFKSLLHRRKRALSHLSLNSYLSLSVKAELVTDRNDVIPSKRPGSSGKQKLVEVKSEEIDGNLVSQTENGRFEGSRGGSEGGDLPGSVMEVHEDATNDKKEVEERLQVLNAKKHNLVQVLRQILNAEEELKRHSSITPPSLPLHVDVSNDSNDSGDNPGTRNDDAGNHNNAQTPTLLRICGASSSSESPLRRAADFSQHNMAPHPSRWTSGLVPSQPGNPSAAGVTVSASGTNYIASSPSPAGSGGTSVFRETPLQTPCN
ncbi:hypothetical protein Bca52824_023081 [Brassica carinata]|uniref:Uncharacterized protein n=1 Tax=Brassica carinata TaxID=52824 RepID=A0A8X7VHV7_BRACI|nr:hypothetical protein Bca52824_023081 [Brassica carinata]